MSANVVRAVVVDDEPVARERMALLCAGIDGLAVVGNAFDGVDALAKIRGLSPDLVLLDIAMPGLDGMAVAETISQLPVPPCIVFCTASDRDAIAAFDVSATDYLLKPISRERLALAVEKVRLRLAAGSPAPKRPWIDHLWVPHRGAMHRIAVDDLDWIEAERDYVRLWTRETNFLLHDTLTRIDGVLDPEVFVRIRRSAIVRRSSIRTLRHDGAGVWSASLEGGATIRIGPTYLSDIRASLKGMKAP